MSEQYAGLTLGVDVSQVDNATKSLANFKRANNETKVAVEDLGQAEALARAKAKALKEEQAQLARETQELQRGLKGIISSIDPTTRKMDKLADAARNLDRAWEKGIIPDDEFFRLGAVIDMQTAKLRETQKALTAEGAAARENANAKRQAEASTKSFLSSLKEQAETIGMSRVELLEYKAAQLGVEKQAAPLIAQLKNQTKQFGVAGISAGQYNQAMRMLPAQITDVVTSLASGMPVWLVAIQQGGQIKDSFGGVGNTFKVLLGYLTPVRVGMAGLAAVLAGIGLSAWDSYEAMRAFEESLVLTGNYAAANAGQLSTLSEEINNNSLATIGSIEKIAATLAGSGKYTYNQIKQITKVTADWSTVTGESADKIIGHFDDIAKDPVKGLASLNEQFNFLEKGQLTYISTLEKTKGKTAAVDAATKLFADTMENRISKLAETATPLEVMWNNIKKWSGDAWKWVGDHTIGALNLITDVVAGTIEQVQYLLNSGDSLIRGFVLSAQEAFQKIPGFKSIGDDAIAQNRRVLAENEETNKKLLASIAERDKRIRQGEMGYIKSNEARAASDKQYSDATKDAIRKEADELAKKNKTQKVAVDYGDKISEQYHADIIALQAQLKVLQDHRQIDEKISQQRKTYWNDVAKFQVLEEAAKTRILTKDEKALLASKDKVLAYSAQKAMLGDQIVSQERLNKLQDDSVKFVNEMDAKTKSIAATAAMSNAEQERYNELQKLRNKWTAGGGSENDPGLKAQEDSMNNYYDAIEKRQYDWVSGAQKAFADWGKSANDMYSNVQGIATNALNNMSSMLTEALMTGKANFGDFAKSVISDIVSMIMKMVVFNTIASAFGMGGTFSFAGMAGHANGGVVGNASFARGGYTGDGGKYQPAGIVHKGEFVFTKEATKRIGVANLHRMMRGYANGGVVGGSSRSGSGFGGGGLMVSVGDVSIQSGMMDNGETAKGIDAGVRQIFTEMLTKACSQGGQIYNFLNNR